ncbi:MAG: DUF448 domain-containing protein [Emcibacter sp.]|nr:DUF448 domain-containing protein [Emcibacter sp.]
MSKNLRSKKPRAKKPITRKCLVTGDTYETHKLIRFVLDPVGNVTPDVAAKLPGRGGWVLAEGKTLKSAMKKKTFVRFGHKVLASSSGKQNEATEDEKKQVQVDEGLPDLVEKLLRQRCLNYLGLVNRAGRLVSGFEKTRSALKSGKVRALIMAEDAAEGGRSKICSGLGNVLEKLPVIDMFTRDELGQTLGLSNAVNVALLSGGMTESFLEEFSRYEGVVMR